VTAGDAHRIDMTPWRHQPRPRSKWRRKARKVIDDVVNANCGMWGSNPRVVDAEDIASKIDAAYPFGPLSNEPYKAWLCERKLVRVALGVDASAKLPPPGPDDAEACMVALDLVEEGRKEAAKRLLDEQAPNRLNRKCLACGAAIGKPCRDQVGETRTKIIHNKYYVEKIWAERIVPHETRVGAPMRKPADGPLFGGLP
jgi:hypothetical protein